MKKSIKTFKQHINESNFDVKYDGQTIELEWIKSYPKDEKNAENLLKIIESDTFKNEDEEYKLQRIMFYFLESKKLERESIIHTLKNYSVNVQ